jgi:hypothetical protein
MALQIFISYRHQDAQGYAGRLSDRLADRFGSNHVFMDIDTIEPGVDFRDALNEAINDCDVAVVVIGQQWLTAVDRSGHRRLDNPNDYHRIEIETALDRDVRVIPVLVDGAEMPNPDELPETMRALCFRNAHEIGKNFHGDVNELMARLERIEAPKDRRAEGEGSSRTPRTSSKGPSPRRNQKVLGAVAALAVVVGVVVGAIALIGGGGGGSSEGAAGQEHMQDSGGSGAPAGTHSLAGLVPFFGEWNCALDTSSPVAGVMQKAECRPSEGADQVELTLFDSATALDVAYGKLLKAAQVSSPSDIRSNTGVCTETKWGGESEWVHAKGIPAGRRLCYLTTEPSAHLIWTYHDFNLLVNAQRGDTAHPELKKFFDDHAHDIGESDMSQGDMSQAHAG